MKCREGKINKYNNLLRFVCVLVSLFSSNAMVSRFDFIICNNKNASLKSILYIFLVMSMSPSLW